MKTILSIDGGGIRGVIPATILAEIERQTGKSISQLFDLIAGTSTGGIIALMLAMPDKGGKQKYSAEDVKNLYIRLGKQVFHRSLVRCITSLGSLTDAKYSAKPLERCLIEYFGDTRLDRALTDVLVPAYEMETSTPTFFKSSYAKDPWKSSENPALWQVARATSAAPTYFPPFSLCHPFSPCDGISFIDGGIFANNPAVCAFSEAYATYGREEDYLLVSLGTGEHHKSYPYEQIKHWGLLEWARPIFDTTMNAASATVDYQLRALMRQTGGNRYFRLQVQLDDDATKMDDASNRNMQRLKGIADAAIESNALALSQICRLLRDHT